MAVYFLHVKIFSRANGSRVTKAAAYRSGEHIRDERTGEGYNYTSRTDIAHKEIMLPAEIARQEEMNWARDRSTLWNAAEHAGRLRNSRLGREVLVILPPELTPAQRTQLVQRFSQELADKYKNAVDFAIHEPRAGADERHHHAHILMTTRQVTPQGMGPRTTLDLSGTERHALGLGPSRDDLIQTRVRWAELTNDAFRAAGLTERVDHRSYRDQGVNREAKPVMPQSIFYQEKLSGMSNPAGDEIRARHRERLEARARGGDELERVIQRQKEENRQRATERAQAKAASPKRMARGSLTPEELKERSHAYYAANREKTLKRQLERRLANPEEWRRKHREWAEQRRARKEAGLPTRKAWAPILGARQQTRNVAGPVPNPPAQAEPASKAEESVKNWMAYRETQTAAPAADESLKRWMAYRQNDQSAPTVGDAKDRLPDKGSDSPGKKDDERPPETNRRRRDHDAGL